MAPRTFYDLVIQVAIVRPGPIQGDMVHPYRRRRNGEEEVTYPTRSFAGYWNRRSVCPCFRTGDAGRDRVRRFHRKRSRSAAARDGDVKLTGGVSHFRDKLINGMVDRGYDQEFEEKTFKQIEGFGFLWLSRKPRRDRPCH